MIKNPHYPVKGILFALSSALSTAYALNVGKEAMQALSFLTFGIYLAFFSSVFSGLGLLATKKMGPQENSFKLSWSFLFHVIFFSIGINFYWESISFLHPGVASFVGRSEMVFTIILSAIFLKERLNLFEFLGVFIVISGLLVIASPHVEQLSEGSSGQEIQGMSKMLMGVFVVAISEIFAKNSLKTLTPLQFTFSRNVCLIFIYSVVAYLSEKFYLIDSKYIYIAIVTALFAPTLGRYFYMKAIEEMPLSRASIFIQMQPIFAGLIGYYMYQKEMNSIEWGGGFIIILGCLFVIYFRNKN